MTFETLGLPARILKNLAEMGISDPSPIQAKAIPLAMEGRDVMGLAQTGTGKTAAFGLPIVSKLLRLEGRPDPKSVRGLVLAPTRELAGQIRDNLRAYAEGTSLRINLVVGGAGINGQINRLQRGTDVLVATPGRLIDLLDRRAVRLDKAKFLVLDEADQMLDLGFIHALRRIAPLLPKERQTMLFSATMPKQMAELSEAYLTDAVRVETAPPGKPADKIEQFLHFVVQSEKAGLLKEHLAEHRSDQALVFSRTKHGAEKLMKGLVAAGFEAASIHGNKSQGQRDRAIKAFRAGELMVLVATDVAARGIDIPEVRYVYNFDLPNVPDNYVHRIGRTARAGRDGTAIAYCAPDEMGELKAIQKVMKRDIPVASGRPWDPVDAPKKGRPGGGRRRGGPGGGGGQAKKQGGAPKSGQRRRNRRSKAA
ncbi:DEAD/DEAH box helicase [Thalassococcus lentus]|uniref:DEAD/DEAH box helicase n=1 Tax=Thalassococcus lentus TaxID=1210524 RepID=A0ABT4XMN4_9RHOB|nr:DEAD/DEAH box helicase [Thalassococcus lentus]MDA7423133.1 DEAD/DEAH box helicase [Thalassococcus lentus]